MAAARPSWLLTGSKGYVGDGVNERTAIGFTKEQLSIHATFFPDRPPQPSKLLVHCPDAKYIKDPRVLCMAGDLILFRVAVATGRLRIRSYAARRWSQYFVYRAVPYPRRATLKLLPDPERPTGFHDCEVAILPRGGNNGRGDFTVAALAACPSLSGLDDKFELLLLHSDSGALSWTSMKLSVVGPPKEFPIEAEDRIDDLSRHWTTNVVVIGGERGTVAWVDLWRGILLCDLLLSDDKPTPTPMLRTVTVPLPMAHITGNDHFGRGMDRRGIAFINGCFKFVQLDLEVTELMHIRDPETGFPTMIVHDWTITTYSNSNMSCCSYEDWHKDGMVRSSEVTINNPTMVTDSSGGLLLRNNALHNLVVSDPSPSLDDDGVVYLVARVKIWHPKAWLISLDMRNKTLRSVVPLVIPKGPYEDLMYCTSRQ